MQIEDIPSEILGQIGNVRHVILPRQGHTSTVAVLDTFDRKYVIKKRSMNSTMNGYRMSTEHFRF